MYRRPLLLAALTLALHARAMAAELPARPTLDALALSPVGNAAAMHLDRLRSDPALQRLGTVAHVEERLGVPTFVWAGRPAVAPAATAIAPRGPRTLESTARGHLERLSPLYRLEGEDVRAAVLRHVHDTGAGAIIASFKTEIDGIEVFRDEMKVLMDRRLELVAIAGSLPSRALAARGGRSAFEVQAPAAIAGALADFGVSVGDREVRAQGEAPGGYTRFDVQTPGSRPRVRAKRVYFRLPEALEAGWYVEVVRGREGTAYVISAVDREILFRHDLVAAEAYSYRVWSDTSAPFVPHDGPQGIVPTPHPAGTPNAYDPAFTSPSLVTLPHGTISTNDPWLPSGALETLGNNVDAYADLFAPDGFSAGDLRATTTGPNVFDRAYDPMLNPDGNTDQQMAAVTQLFFTNNFLHDWFYDAGFDEAAGNAQASNYGRGGVEGDVMHTRAQAYWGTNNAMMMTPADGESPVMYMMVWEHPTVGTLTGISPGSIAGDYATGPEVDFAPSTFDVTGELVLVNDGSGTDACQPIVNDIAGKIALHEGGGSCEIGRSRVANIEAAGAIAAIYASVIPGEPPAILSGSPALSIPVLSVTYETAQALKTELWNGTVVVRLLRRAQVVRDAALDNQIVAHEWGHYLTNRLIGDGSGLATTQSFAMGEGWGDFLSMLLTVRAEDALAPGNGSFEGVYGMAGYAASRSLAPNDAYYFGVRRYPYSTDFAKNPLTFRHVQNGVPLPVGPPVAFGANGGSNDMPHRAGEVWCNMLWECYAALLRDTGRLTFDQARDRMRAYLVAALKLTPVLPTFSEARDALLGVAMVQDPADFAAFCGAFARRGLGSGAVSPDRYAFGNLGVAESFACGGALEFVAATLDDDAAWCDRDGYLDAGETGWLRVTLRNAGVTALAATTASLSSAHPGVSFPNGASVAFPASTPYTDVVAAIPVSFSGAGGVQEVTFTISYEDANQAVPGARTASFTTYVHADPRPSTLETVEALVLPWTMDVGAGTTGEPWERRAVAPSSHRFYARVPVTQGDLRLTSPPLQIAPSGDFEISFSHAHHFFVSGPTHLEGGVLEITDDDGATWTDIAGPAYSGAIGVGFQNPLEGRNAWTGKSPGHPALQPVHLNLGTAWAGETVRVRFRLGSDCCPTNTAGWDIDNVAFTNLVNQPFTQLDPEADACSTPLAVDDEVVHEVGLDLVGRHPFAGEARFRFTLPGSGRASLMIYDVFGRRVATLANGAYAAGEHATTWRRPGATPAGVYFARFSTGGRDLTRRFVMTR